MNNKQVFLKPSVVFETLAKNWYAWSDLRFFESFPYRSNFYNEKCKSISPQITSHNELRYCLSITGRHDFDNIILKVPFNQPSIDDLVNDMLVLLSFSGSRPDGTHSTSWVGKQCCFTKKPLINHLN
jgi:hypothetical protein